MLPYDNQKLADIVKELDIIDTKTLIELLKKSLEQKTPLGDLILEQDVISEENLGRILADLIQIPLITLATVDIDDTVLRLIPQDIAKKQGIIAFKKDGDKLCLGMKNPKDIELINNIQKYTGLNITPYLAMKMDLTNSLALYSKDNKSKILQDSGIVAEVENVEQKIEPTSTKHITPWQNTNTSTTQQQKDVTIKKDPEVSIVNIVDNIIQNAYESKASDIHIEPWEDKTLVRYRIDGIMHDILDLGVELHERMVSRIKLMAQLRIDEHQAAQDGKIKFKVEAEELDIRVSIVPVTHGEKAVMRLLAEHSRHLALNDIGLTEMDLEKIQNAYQKPYGMILSTGPTGCGKTTTMYTILKLLNKRELNVMTIEDPVEYGLKGVNQIQVNAKTNMTFASGLKSIVRQDPNVILVGEIRDEETAHIAVNAALTGHLLLSTLHTNDALTALPRLMEMGIEPYLVASSVNVIIGQRLVRKICEKCRTSYETSNHTTTKRKNEITKDEHLKELEDELVKKYFGKDETVRLYKGKGCPVCHNTGYNGRVGIFEVLLVDDQIKKLISEKSNIEKLYAQAKKSGMKFMIEDGIDKVKQGITTVEEILRVTK